MGVSLNVKNTSTDYITKNGQPVVSSENSVDKRLPFGKLSK